MEYGTYVITIGGEEYLTFSSCTLNSGAAMDPKSGIFTAPVTGSR
jgi:hypothetical protein